MKTIYQYKLILGIALSVLMSSCLGDLDQEPTDGTMLVAEKVYQEKGNYKKVLAKCYSSMAIAGQMGPSGDGDLSGIDEAYSSYARAFFYLQVVSTDEAISTSSSNGMRDMVTMNWTPNTGIIGGAYSRLYVNIGYCNEFLRQSTPEKLASRGQNTDEAFVKEVEKFRNEARFIRAFCYWSVCDAFGAGPFIDENDPVDAKFLPQEKSRADIYKFVEDELLYLEKNLLDPKTNEYARVDKAAAWFMLARLYLNAEVYIGAPAWEKSLEYAEKTITSGYTLAPKFKYNFLADNHTSPEIIWPLSFDGVRTKTYGGSTFFVLCQVGGKMMNYVDFGIGGGWGNIRLRPEYSDKFDASDVDFDINDVDGNNKGDKRSMLYTHEHKKEISSLSSKFGEGYAFTKWRNVTKDGKAGSDAAYVDVDYPLLRLSDAYLMAAEAATRVGGAANKTKALGYINEVRDRAYESGSYGSAAGSRITEDKLDLNYILDERSRELAWELTRRIDLIRYGQFTDGTYHWAWKGNVKEGKAIDKKYNLFPIPESDMTANPNLKGNPDFN